jgi:hypothetical protein
METALLGLRGAVFVFGGTPPSLVGIKSLKTLEKMIRSHP